MPWHRAKQSRSAQRKLGNLVAVREDQDRCAVAAVFDVATLREKFREVHDACFPSRKYVQIEVRDYLRGSKPNSCAWLVRDTNSLDGGRQAEWYSRPGLDLCSEDHAPVTWLYATEGGGNLRGILTIAAFKAALSDLARVTGQPIERVEVLVQTVWLKKKLLVTPKPIVVEPSPPPLDPTFKRMLPNTGPLIELVPPSSRKALAPVTPPVAAEQPSTQPPRTNMEERYIMSWRRVD